MCRCYQCNREITPSPSAPIAVTVRDPTHRLELSFHVQSDGNARESAIAASLALQFGCPAETLRGAVLRNSNGTACTPLGAALDQIAGFQKVQLSAREV